MMRVVANLGVRLPLEPWRVDVQKKNKEEDTAQLKTLMCDSKAVLILEGRF